MECGTGAPSPPWSTWLMCNDSVWEVPRSKLTSGIWQPFPRPPAIPGDDSACRGTGITRTSQCSCYWEHGLDQPLPRPTGPVARPGGTRTAGAALCPTAPEKSGEPRRLVRRRVWQTEITHATLRQGITLLCGNFLGQKYAAEPRYEILHGLRYYWLLATIQNLSYFDIQNKIMKSSIKAMWLKTQYGHFWLVVRNTILLLRPNPVLILALTRPWEKRWFRHLGGVFFCYGFSTKKKEVRWGVYRSHYWYVPFFIPFQNFLY